MKKLYTQAAPRIRGRLVLAVHKGLTSTLKRDQAAGMAEAWGLASALKIMAHSEDQTSTPGIHFDVFCPSGALEATREYLQSDADLILGTEPAPVTPQADLPAPVVPSIPRVQ